MLPIFQIYSEQVLTKWKFYMNFIIELMDDTIHELYDHPLAKFLLHALCAC